MVVDERDRVLGRQPHPLSEAVERGEVAVAEGRAHRVAVAELGHVADARVLLRAGLPRTALDHLREDVHRAGHRGDDRGLVGGGKVLGRVHPEAVDDVVVAVAAAVVEVVCTMTPVVAGLTAAPAPARCGPRRIMAIMRAR